MRKLHAALQVTVSKLEFNRLLIEAQTAVNEALPLLPEYILYALTRQLAQTYTVHVVSEEGVAQQQAQFAALLEELGQPAPAALTAAFAARESSALEPELTPDVITRLQARLARTSRPETSGNNA